MPFLYALLLTFLRQTYQLRTSPTSFYDRYSTWKNILLLAYLFKCHFSVFNPPLYLNLKDYSHGFFV